MPQRIQRRRTKGFNLQAASSNPNGVVYVGRPSKWGNCFPVGLWFRRLTSDWSVWSHGDGPFGNESVQDLEQSLALFEEYARARVKWDRNWLKPLQGKDLACWCKTSDKCHADVLLELLGES